ncbi:hypothetical protein ABER23_06515 [Paenibacillus lautus]|uniref:hypothetical protein n=1 Tax=Paenibacillus lautus TaxID=1401 RepID=UPI003D286016
MNTRMRNPIFGFLISVLLLIVFSVPTYAADTTYVGETPSGIPYDRLEQEIDSYVNSHIGKSTPGAAIVVTKGDKVIFSKGYGYANIEKKNGSRSRQYRVCLWIYQQSVRLDVRDAAGGSGQDEAGSRYQSLFSRRVREEAAL